MSDQEKPRFSRRFLGGLFKPGTPTPKDDSTAHESSTSSQMPRRSFLIKTGALVTGVAATGLYTKHRVDDSLEAMNECAERWRKIPPRKLSQTTDSLVGLIKKLKTQGYNMFCVGDANHNSAAADETVIQLLDSKDIGITDYFIENPEKDKRHPAIGEAISDLPWQKEDSVSRQGWNKIKALLTERTDIACHDTDTQITPYIDDVTLKMRHSAGKDTVLDNLELMLDGRDYVENNDKELASRNRNMADAIAKVFAAKQKTGEKGCFLFQVGNGHLIGPDPETTVPTLLKANPGLDKMKIAMIEVVPVKTLGQEWHEKVWKNSDNHFVVTYNDFLYGKRLNPAANGKGCSIDDLGTQCYFDAAPIEEPLIKIPPRTR